jgi:arylsulfatase A-like enzyme
VNENDLDDVPPAGRAMAKPEGDHRKVIQTNNWRKAVQGYLASISFVDACIGRLLDAFDKSQYVQNTIVVLWGDHGWHLGEKLHWRKFALWEEATHAPFMMVVPGMTQAESRCKRTVSFLDMYPTLVDLCGLPARKELEGISLKPLLTDAGAQWARPALTTHGLKNHTVRSEQWRYIRYADGSEELYDHEKDELEWANMANKPEFADVKKELAKWLPETDAPNAPRSGKGGEGEGQDKPPKGARKKKAQQTAMAEWDWDFDE